eukprot:CAMPEP_0206000286 /NCGR_PEP_ID=MMETSP1464-20131121/1372_1 /ASSEMBLY_ACC=CAM_ASM_001124 /TAXON_ID=119497 /ORGANISM="Exanthemachrysis gayraliae, Strain RCC1523" /LENGTH=365 /DNA_ID=CAMNT_0053373539 /DNA_START=27 /DNA_END=1121 /DNA_ORIENTATION=-
MKVTVKWGKQKFDNVEIDVSAKPTKFKEQLFQLTGVPVDRQKIMGVKGGQLKDDADWDVVGIKPGQNLMLMGTADKLVEPPKEPTKFVEDMPEVADVADMQLPAGLRNLGNTCYLNSSLQVMRSVPEFNLGLQRFVSPQDASEPGAALALAVREVLSDMERSTAAREVTPIKFVATFRRLFPRFAEQAENGGFAQQDAEECWSQILSSLSSRMRVTDGDRSNTDAPTLPSEGQLRDNFGDVLFGVQLTSTLKCAEAPDEPAQTSTDALRRLSCHIAPGCAHLYNAIELSLEESVEKNSPSLGRTAVYKKTSRIARLPPYLAVQFVRFAWRADSQKRCKVLKEVSFPDMLDLRNLLDPALKRRVEE